MATTLRDVAKQVGLSHSTVSVILNGRRDIKIPETTRDRVIKTAREMGYRPNRVARSLVKGRQPMVAIWTPSVRSPYFGKLFQCLSDECRLAGFVPVYCSGTSEVENLPYNWPVEAILAIDVADLVAHHDIPMNMPLIGLGVFVDKGADHVSVELNQPILELLSGLYEAGKRRFAILEMSRFSLNEQGPSAASRRFCALHKLPLQVIGIQDWENPDIASAIRESIEKGSLPEVLVCANDAMAIRAIRVLKDLGYSVPQDLQVTGCDGIGYGEIGIPSLTSIEQPVEEISVIAVRMLVERMQDPDRELQSEALFAKVIWRESATK